MKYRKIPVEIEAFEFKPRWGKMGAPIAAAFLNIPTWFIEAEIAGKVHIWGDDEEPYCMIETLEGRMKAQYGDYIVLGVKNEIYPCKPDIFKETYEPAPTKDTV